MQLKLFRSSCSLVVCGMLVATPQFPAFAQSPDFSQLPSPSWDSSKVSPAVMDNVNQAIRNFGLKKQAQQLTASDVDVAAAPMKTAYDHFQEIGYTAAVEKKILANEDAYLNYHPSQAYIQSFEKQLAAQGFHVNAARVRSFLDPDQNDRQRFLAMVKSQGLYKTEIQMVEQFRTEQMQFVSQSSVGADGQLARNHQTNGHVVRVMSDWYWACLIAAGVGIATGCTITVWACTAAVLACGECAAVC